MTSSLTELGISDMPWIEIDLADNVGLSKNIKCGREIIIQPGQISS
jgi:hypothetical protein